MDACRRSRVAMALAVALLATTPLDIHADVVRIEILSRQPANDGRPVGTIGEFEILRGKIYGEIDPADPHNKVIQDLELAPRNDRGKVEYVATFSLAKPVDMTKAARVLLYQVVNRGNGQVTIGPEGYISLISGWQGDVVPTPTNQTIVVPVAKARGGRALTGRVIARFIDVPNGVSTAPIRLASLGTPQPYLPADLSERGAVMTMYSSESRSGAQQGRQTIARVRLGLCELRKDAVPRHSRSHTRLPARGVSCGSRLSARLHGEGSARARRRAGGHARCRLVLPLRRSRSERHAESRRRGDRPGREHRRFAVRKLHPHLHPSRIQPGRIEPDRLGRSLSPDRGTADPDEPPLRAARAARPASTNRAATGSCGGGRIRIGPAD